MLGGPGRTTLPMGSRRKPGRSVSSVSPVACSYPVTAVIPASRTASDSADDAGVWAEAPATMTDSNRGGK